MGASLLLQLHHSKCHTAAQGLLSPVGPRLGGLSCRHTEAGNGQDDTVIPECKAAPSPGTTRERKPRPSSVACSWTPREPKPTGVGLATDTWSSQAELGPPKHLTNSKLDQCFTFSAHTRTTSPMLRKDTGNAVADGGFQGSYSQRK